MDVIYSLKFNSFNFRRTCLVPVEQACQKRGPRLILLRPVDRNINEKWIEKKIIKLPYRITNILDRGHFYVLSSDKL